ncbi:MAG: conjugal transfer protein TraC [Candidatus Nealsonbacteria bacterium CG08_land_8_20_14_0_20_43_11]|uniref:Conjugal transfer protein TraC n=1 Tax=Candidatus Nealsonbacteria bacterium CG08_land_8_20_14_0_20_43_11 TaxID=1974706 RepID=A0A2M6T044_9BACT|nr:MAG: conjugal transfer protein TraC [Candidatus Nealsonbacteria bacterium CG08_land_8_20_14_0_20_43_11]
MNPLKKFFKKIVKTEATVSEPAETNLKDVIAPSSIEIAQNYIKLGEKLIKTFFVFSFPKYLSSAWLSPIINSDAVLDISLFIHPVDMNQVLRQLRRKVTETQAELMEREEKGLVRDPALEIAFQDIETLRERLQSAQERMFRLGLYITVYGDSEKELRDTEVSLRSMLEGRLIYLKPALYQQREGIISTMPYGLDLLLVHTPMNTEPLSSVFPFTSFDLSSNEGILYGINQHNNSLVLFNRFSLENYNEVFFGTTGSGKSYFAKTEVLRSLMMGVDVLVIDPENEYKVLAETVGGSFFRISISSEDHINPFDLPMPREDENPEDVLRSSIMNMVSLSRIMLGGLNPEEDAIIDRAITETYAARDITPNSDPATWNEKTPLLSDLQQVLETMEGAESLVRRLSRFTTGTYANFFNNPTNVDINNNMVVFGIRDMEEELRPMAMFVIMRHVWNAIRSELKKRILVVDEAWWIMQTEDGASFLYGLVKRARKYWLGVTTITQDVSDFMRSDYGQPIINNSVLKVLMKQSPAVIEVVKKVFNLTEEEKFRLLEGAVGEGIFFAGQKHVAIRSVASYAEDQIITTSPEEIVRIKETKRDLINKP